MKGAYRMLAGIFTLDPVAPRAADSAPDIASALGVDFVFKALGYGAMGVAAIVLCLSYLLVRQLAAANPPRSPDDTAWLLVQRYMRFALICTAAMVLLQIGDQMLTFYKDQKLQALERRVLSVANFTSVPEWHWDWGKGGWETKGAFIRRADGKYDFSATTLVTEYNQQPATIVEWRSTQPFDVPDDGSAIVFLGKRRVLGPQGVLDRAYAGPTDADYPTRFTLQPTWALIGKYSGPNGEGPFGNLRFSAANP
jgi:hypothetical protein